jgi:nucleoside-diphosphate-sugar epimerase
VSKYFLTGAAGFIASRVAALLLAAGHQVIGVDNLNDAYDVRLKRQRLDELRPIPGFEFFERDITDRAGLAALWESSQAAASAAVINLAARAGVRQSVQDPWAYFETNVTGTLNLPELCRRSGVPKFVLASTSSLYGRHNPLPFTETADTNQPLSPYAASKKAAEVLCHTYHTLHGLDVTVFRYFTVYGPAGRPDMSLFRFVQWISEGRPVRLFGDGAQSRDFTFVDDIARGTILGLRPLGYATFNLGSDRPWSLLDAVQLIEECTGQPARLEIHPAQPADVPATWANIDRARHDLGWEPQVSLPDGVERLVAWYRANRAWACEINTDG